MVGFMSILDIGLVEALQIISDKLIDEKGLYVGLRVN